MRRQDWDYLVGFILIISVACTGLAGFVAARLELHRFVPHKYFAYTTLSLATLHLYFNLPKLWRYIKARRK